MRRIGLRLVLAGLIGCVVLAGCGGDPVRDTSEDIEFQPCSAVECAGTLPSGADFDVIMPVNWNGTLAIYSHSLVSADPDQTATPDPTATPEPTKPASPTPQRSGKSPSPSEPPPPSPSVTSASPRPGGPQLAPLWIEGDQALVDVMLQAGYAIAGAAPTAKGWNVAAQMTAARELHQYFSDTIGEPNRVYLWGESTGGLASARLAQTDDWVSGALAFCAPMSGPVQSFNLALDVMYSVRQLLLPNMRLSGYSSQEDAERVRDRAVAAVREAATGSPQEQAKVVFIAAIGALPNRSRTENGSTLVSQIAANTEGIAELVEQGTVQRYEFEQVVGGNASGNAGTDYSLRISTAQRAQIDSLVPDVSEQMLATLAAGTRVTPDPAALDSAREQGELGSELPVPVLTVHNVYDPVYIVQNESWFEDLVAGADVESQGHLVNAFVYPPRTYSSVVPASEGVGNCDFEARTLFGGLLQLNRWVRGGEYPGRDSVAELFRGQSVTLDFEPAPWPQMSATPLPDEGGSPTGGPMTESPPESPSQSPTDPKTGSPEPSDLGKSRRD